MVTLSSSSVPGTMVSTPSKVFILVKNTISFNTAFIDKLLKTGERGLATNTIVATHLEGVHIMKLG